MSGESPQGIRGRGTQADSADARAPVAPWWVMSHVVLITPDHAKEALLKVMDQD